MSLHGMVSHEAMGVIIEIFSNFDKQHKKASLKKYTEDIRNLKEQNNGDRPSL